MKKIYSVIALAVGSLVVSTQANAQWAPLIGSRNGTDATVYALGGAKTNLYIGGAFFNPFQDLCEWTGSSFISSGVTPSQPVYAFATWDSVTYIGTGDAVYQRIGGSTIKIATLNDPCYALCVWKKKLYAGGWMNTVNSVKTGFIAVYDGATWDSIPVEVDNWPKAMCVYNGMLAVGGYMNYSSKKDTLYGVGLWNGTKWTPLNKGIQGSGGVFAMDTMGGNLYIGGQFDSASTAPALYHHVFVRNLAMWNGTTWDSVGHGATGTVYAMTNFNGSIVVGGYFDSVEYWNGTKWTFNGQMTSGDEVNALTVNNGILYAGGYFTTIGSSGTANYVAQFTLPTAVNEVNATNGVQIYPNPSSGIFTVKSSVNSNQLSVEIYNILGEKVQSFITHNSEFSIDLSGQAKGIYVYRVFNQNGENISSGKLVIQ